MGHTSSSTQATISIFVFSERDQSLQECFKNILFKFPMEKNG